MVCDWLCWGFCWFEYVVENFDWINDVEFIELVLCLRIVWLFGNDGWIFGVFFIWCNGWVGSLVLRENVILLLVFGY